MGTCGKLTNQPESIGRLCDPAIRAYQEFVVVLRVKKLYPALKHGGYSATGLLPGEDRVAFEKLHRDLIAELCPHGPLEEDTVADIARCMWRKNHLETFRRAEAARKRYSAIKSEMIPSTTPPFELPFEPVYLKDDRVDWTPPDPDEVKAAREAAEARAREELGVDYKFVEIDDLPTPAQMLADLEVEERLDARIDKLFKRLAMLKAFKLLSATRSSSSTEVPRVSGPKKAA
jgi:hypothetical protein